VVVAGDPAAGAVLVEDGDQAALKHLCAPHSILWNHTNVVSLLVKATTRWTAALQSERTGAARVRAH
jgi:hypothetical protein